MITTDKYVFFWGGIYSNWFPCELNIDGVKYNCVEQYMMAQKAVTSNDIGSLCNIMSEADPARQKAMGRKVKNFDPNTWALIARDVVYKACLEKFQHPDLKAQLLATGDKEIVEASPYDKIWGVGLGEDNPLILDKANWQGTNWLGEVLMKVRSNIK